MKHALIAAAAGLLFGGAAMAHTATYTGTFSGTGTAGTGSISIVFDHDLMTMDISASFSGLGSNTTSAHIHCCTVDPNTGNAGVAVQSPTIAGFPLGATSGSYSAHFDMTLISSYSSGFISGNGGTPTGAYNALVAAMDTSRAYFNIHTSAFPVGEIRANLAPVPEPASYGLMALGLGVVGAVARRQRRPGAAAG